MTKSAWASAAKGAESLQKNSFLGTFTPGGGRLPRDSRALGAPPSPWGRSNSARSSGMKCRCWWPKGCDRPTVPAENPTLPPRARRRLRRDDLRRAAVPRLGRRVDRRRDARLPAAALRRPGRRPHALRGTQVCPRESRGNVLGIRFDVVAAAAAWFFHSCSLAAFRVCQKVVWSGILSLGVWLEFHPVLDASTLPKLSSVSQMWAKEETGALGNASKTPLHTVGPPGVVSPALARQFGSPSILSPA